MQQQSLQRWDVKNERSGTNQRADISADRLASVQPAAELLRNRQNKTRLAYQSGALEALELLIKELLLEEEYEEWRKTTWKTKQSI